LGVGECPNLAVLKLSELADHGLVNGQQLVNLEGINERLINTGDESFKHTDALYLQPNAVFFFLLYRLFNVSCGARELRYLFTGPKHTKSFADTGDVLKAIARTLLAHERKLAEQERSGRKAVGITNVVAYINSGLHGKIQYLRQSVRGDQSYIERVNSMYNSIQEEVETYKNKRNIEKGESS